MTTFHVSKSLIIVIIQYRPGLHSFDCFYLCHRLWHYYSGILIVAFLFPSKPHFPEMFMNLLLQCFHFGGQLGQGGFISFCQLLNAAGKPLADPSISVLTSLSMVAIPLFSPTKVFISVSVRA